MVPDCAPGDCTQYRVVMSVVTRDRADHSAFEAALGIGRSSALSHKKRHRKTYDQSAVHFRYLLLVPYLADPEYELQAPKHKQDDEYHDNCPDQSATDIHFTIFPVC
jgi:hypothetical protein